METVYFIEFYYNINNIKETAGINSKLISLTMII